MTSISELSFQNPYLRMKQILPCYILKTSEVQLILLLRRTTCKIILHPCSNFAESTVERGSRGTHDITASPWQIMI